MKKILLCMIVGLLCFGCQPKEKEVSEELYSTANQYADAMINKDFDKLETQFKYSQEMKTAIDSGQLTSSLSMNMDALGKLKDKKDAYALTSDDKVAIHIPCEFENQKINITVTFDDTQQIIGVFFNEYQEEN